VKEKEILKERETEREREREIKPQEISYFVCEGIALRLSY
jgi:hypothetical protein